MKTLSQKGIVSEHGRPTRRYQLTDEGWEIARGMRGVEAGNRSVSGSAATSRAVSRTTSNQRETSVQVWTYHIYMTTGVLSLTDMLMVTVDSSGTTTRIRYRDGHGFIIRQFPYKSAAKGLQHG